MLPVLQTAATVGTPLALLGLCAAFGYFAYTRRLKHAETQLKELPDDQRATAIDERLTWYGIDGANLTRAVKFKLIERELETRHRRSMLLLCLATLATVGCFIVAAVAFMFDSKVQADTGESALKVDRIDESTAALIQEIEARAVLVLDGFYRKLTSIQEKMKEGLKAQSEVDLLHEAIARFEQLHQEYVSAVRNQHPQLIHERLGQVKDFHNDPKLMQVMNFTYVPNDSISTELDDDGKEIVKKHATWTLNTSLAAEELRDAYLAPVESDQPVASEAEESSE